MSISIASVKDVDPIALPVNAGKNWRTVLIARCGMVKALRHAIACNVSLGRRNLVTDRLQQSERYSERQSSVSKRSRPRIR